MKDIDINIEISMKNVLTSLVLFIFLFGSCVWGCLVDITSLIGIFGFVLIVIIFYITYNYAKTQEGMQEQ